MASCVGTVSGEKVGQFLPIGKMSPPAKCSGVEGGPAALGGAGGSEQIAVAAQPLGKEGTMKDVATAGGVDRSFDRIGSLVKPRTAFVGACEPAASFAIGDTGNRNTEVEQGGEPFLDAGIFPAGEVGWKIPWQRWQCRPWGEDRGSRRGSDERRHQS